MNPTSGRLGTEGGKNFQCQQDKCCAYHPVDFKSKLNESFEHYGNSPEPQQLQHFQSVCKSGGLHGGAEDSWFWTGRPSALTWRTVPVVGHKMENFEKA